MNEWYMLNDPTVQQIYARKKLASTFSRGDILILRLSSGEKPFLCDFCGRGFRIKYDMVQHRLKTHYGVQPKRRRPQNKIITAVAATPTTTTYQIKDGEMIDEQVSHVANLDSTICIL